MTDIITEHLKALVRKAPAMWCSPYYTVPCNSECAVCNMDKKLYDMVRESIDKDSRYKQYLILREEFEGDDNGRTTSNKERL